MDRTKLLATYLIYRYELLTKSSFNSEELKLQKLMYFLQRHSLAFQNKPLFEEEFQGWKYGPVLVSLRHFFEEFFIDTREFNKLTDIDKFLIDLVIQEYGQYDSWKLRDLSHEEISWIKSREGLTKEQSGKNNLKIEDIMEDAKKINIYSSNNNFIGEDGELTEDEEREILKFAEGPFYNFDDLLNEMGISNEV